MHLQWLQFTHRALMAGLMPHQNVVMPWCVEKSIVSRWCLSEGGMTM